MSSTPVSPVKSKAILALNYFRFQGQLTRLFANGLSNDLNAGLRP